jgi:voltage-gated potassium channel
MIQSENLARRFWNLWVAALAILNGILIPLFVVYPLSAPYVPALSLLIALVFAADIFVEFQTVYQHEGALIVELRERTLRYLKGSLIADILAAFPGLFLQSRGMLPEGLFVVVFFLPLLKLLKVNRTLRESGEPIINPAIFRLMMLVFWILMAAHQIACLWILVSGNPDDLAPLDRYISSFYWTITTIATIGYGDITPKGSQQMLFVILIELLGAAMYGLVIGNIAGLIANIDIAKGQYREKLDKINSFLKYRSIPEHLMKKINNYYSYLWDTRKGYDEIEFLHDLPVALKESVALHLNKEIIERVPLFEKADASLIRDIILQLQPVVFTPGDYIVRAGELGRDMYFISKGTVTVLSADEKITYATLKAGQFFGEISLLLSMPRTATIKAAGFCDLYRLEKDQFDVVVEQYPDFKQSIRLLAEKRREEVQARTRQRTEAPAAVPQADGTVPEKAEAEQGEAVPVLVPATADASNLAITTIRTIRSGGSVVITWQGVPEFLHYEMTMRDNPDSPWLLVGENLPRPAWTEDHPAEGREYRIRCVGADSAGPWTPRIILPVD